VAGEPHGVLALNFSSCCGPLPPFGSSSRFLLLFRLTFAYPPSGVCHSTALSCSTFFFQQLLLLITHLFFWFKGERRAVRAIRPLRACSFEYLAPFALPRTSDEAKTCSSQSYQSLPCLLPRIIFSLSSRLLDPSGYLRHARPLSSRPSNPPYVLGDDPTSRSTTQLEGKIPFRRP
jgi:hypothetical protein